MFESMSKSEFDSAMAETGWVLFPEVLSAQEVASLRNDSLKWIEFCKHYQIKNRINDSGDGTAHQAVGGRDSIDAFLDSHYFHDYLSAYFDEKPYALNACTPVGGFPNADIYVHQVHRDVLVYIPNYHLRINMLVMLDDFTLENGATQILPSSHLEEEKPSDAEFERQCLSLTGKAGSVALFNSYIWHRGGVNCTDRCRVALTLSFGRPFLKPQTDYARMLGDEYGAGLSELSRQVLGYNCRVPISHDEWYRPEAQRLFRRDQW